MTAGLAIQATTGLHSLPISPWAGLGVLAGRERADGPDTLVICGGVVSRGLSTLHIDRTSDSGTYTEPNVWMRHR